MNLLKTQNLIFLFIFWLFPNYIFAQNQKEFASLNEVLEYSKNVNLIFENAKSQTEIAA